MPAQQWQYLVKTITGDANHELEKLGNEGWELVGVRSTRDDAAELYFKRPKTSGVVRRPFNPVAGPPRPEPDIR